jgi:hypothetical protein
MTERFLTQISFPKQRAQVGRARFMNPNQLTANALIGYERKCVVKKYPEDLTNVADSGLSKNKNSLVIPNPRKRGGAFLSCRASLA